MNIKEVAKRAGVSVSTVSRVLNHPDLVREDTRKSIIKIMEELDYSPNWFARNLNLNVTHTLAILVPTIETPFYQRIVAGIEAIANERGYTLILCNTNNQPENERRHLSVLRDRKVDGLIITSTSLLPDVLHNLLEDTIPHVFIGHDERYRFENSCYISFEEAGYRMTQHLVSMNSDKVNERLHVVLDDRSQSRTKKILIGAIQACYDENLAEPKVIQCPNDMGAPYVIARNLIAKQELGQLILCSDDEMAFAIMKAIDEAGQSIPGHYAIAGLSNSIFSSISHPPLTSMDQPAKKLGMVAARLLFDLLDGLDQSEHVVLQSVMKIRRSCGNRKYIHELQEV